MRPADGYDCFLLDLDGTLYRGDETTPGAVDAVERLRDAGKRLVFTTNNSSRTAGDVAGRLRALGFDAREEEVVTSAMVTARVVSAMGPGSAFVVGEEGIRAALTEAGVTLLDGEPDLADHVVVGWDRSADYAKLRTAGLLVQRGANLIATNADGAFPSADGLWPGAGALLAVVTTTTGIAARVIGKPESPIFEAAREAGGGGRPLVVGDRLDTDIAGAARLGWDSLLVFTGVADRAMLSSSEVTPTFVGEDLSSLFEEAEAP